MNVKRALFIGILMGCVVVMALRSKAMMSIASEGGRMEQIDLAQWLGAGKLKSVNREVTKLEESEGAVHVNEKPAAGIIWLEGTNFTEGTLEVDVRGRNVFQKSFVGIAFHGTDDSTYEAVYVRPFNFRSNEPARHDHAVQYIAPPQYDWKPLREKFPGEFENAVDSSIIPTGWVHLRIVVTGTKIQAYVGNINSPTLSVRKLGQQDHGRVGLWAGNNSDGDFANLRIASMK